MLLNFQVLDRLFRVLFFLLATGLFPSASWAQPPWTLHKPAVDFDRSGFVRPEDRSRVLMGGSLGGAAGDSQISGWVEYDFSVPDTGWYELSADPQGPETEYTIDPKSKSPNRDGNIFYGTTNSGKIGNVWLERGPHTLRAERYFWVGFPKIKTFILTRTGSETVASGVHVRTAEPAPIYRHGKCEPLQIFFGGTHRATSLTVTVRNMTDVPLSKFNVGLPASSGLNRKDVPLPCEKEGAFKLTFGENGSDVSWDKLRPLVYEVIDTATTNPAGGKLNRKLIQEIDCATAPPDYFGGGQPKAVTAPLPYLESGAHGWRSWLHAQEAVRKLLPEPSWFAYRLKVDAQQPYLVEVDYPDDARRTFAIALRESNPLSYPVAGGVDSGGEFSLTGQLRTHTLFFWPRSDSARIVFLNAFNGRRAACAAVRIFRINAPLLPLIDAASAGGRDFLDWYEEGSNFTSGFGLRDEYLSEASQEAASRWMGTLRYMGGTAVSPTVAIYSFSLYPSRFNRAFSKPDTDLLRRLVLVAEKHGIKVIPEVHPRADELDWPYIQSPDPKPNLLVSAEGRTSYYGRDGKTRAPPPPLYGPLHPDNQDWYVGMIGELADRYRDSPAFVGVSLRLMDWANPALNNFHSLDWGYDDNTVGLFKSETGSRVPLGDPRDKARFAARHKWLLTNSREAWIAWRCEKIARLHARIRDRLRASRSDLKLYINVNPWIGREPQAAVWREAGMDPQILGRIDGVVLINGTHRYGRAHEEAIWTQTLRDELLVPENLNAFRSGNRQGAFLSSAAYLEATDAIVPPEMLGFPSSTRRTWMSAVAYPSGRHFLERYALQLAETDATLLGDGGNGYSLGQPELREFLREYLRIPSEPFSAREDARDPVSVWQAPLKDNYYFYAVNKERFQVSVRMNLASADPIERLGTGDKIVPRNRSIQFELLPYQLMAFRSVSRQRIESVATTSPEQELTRVRKQVEWLNQLDRDLRSEWIDRLPEQQKLIVHTAAQRAADWLRRGWLWRARTELEHHSLLKIYAALRQYPPDLRDVVVPVTSGQ